MQRVERGVARDSDAVPDAAGDEFLGRLHRRRQLHSLREKGRDRRGVGAAGAPGCAGAGLAAICCCATCPAAACFSFLICSGVFAPPGSPWVAGSAVPPWPGGCCPAGGCPLGGVAVGFLFNAGLGFALGLAIAACGADFALGSTNPL